MTKLDDGILQFDGFRLDIDAGELRREDRVVEVEPQVFDLIVLLARNPKRVISRDEIIELIWNGRIVSESAIANRVSLARRALGDDGKNQRYIKTVHGRGFRFEAEPIAERTREESNVPTEALETESALPEKPSIAVIPFENISAEPEQEFFSDGITEDIITILSKVPHLIVISRNSSFAFKGQNIDIRKVGQHLGVRYVLEGSVRKAGNRVRITAQLIDTKDGSHVWADRYDRDLEDIFAIQDEITTEIVTALEVKLSQGEQVRVWRRQAGDFAAYEHFAIGRDLYMEFNREANAEALPHLFKALEINPEFCSALAFVAWTLSSRANFHWCDDEAATTREARSFAERAIAADPESGSGYASLSSVARNERDFDAALDHARQAVACNPNAADSLQNLALSHNANSNWKEAKRAAEWALRVDPLVPDNSRGSNSPARSSILRIIRGCLEAASRILTP